MSDYQSVSTDDLLARSHHLQKVQDDAREERNAINKELAFRDNLEQRAKAIKGMTKEEIERIMALTSTIEAAGDIPSAETVDGLASK